MLNANKSPQATSIRHSRSHVRIAHEVHPQLLVAVILSAPAGNRAQRPR